MKKLLFLKTKTVGILVIFLLMLGNVTTFAQMTKTSLTDANYGDAYSATVVGDLPVLLGSLPPGMTVAPTSGLLTGTPTSLGTYSFSLTGGTAGVYYEIKVVKKAQAIVLSTVLTKNCGDAKYDLPSNALVGNVNNGLAITYTSSNTAVATVALKSGTNATKTWEVTVVGKGSTDITATLAGNDYYLAATGTAAARTITLVVSAIGAPTVISPQAFSTFQTVADLLPQDSGSGASKITVKWYDTAGVLVPNTTTLVNGKVYYATQSQYGCESVLSGPVTVNLGTVLAPAITTATATFTGCNGTIAGLKAYVQLSTGSVPGVKIYAAATGGAALADAVNLATATYYVSQTVGGFESEARTAVSVTVTQLAKPTGAANQYFLCATFAPKLSGIVVSGTNVKWFTTAALTTAIDTDIDVVNATTYYAVSRNGALLDCYSQALAVTVYTVTPTIVDNAVAPFNAGQKFCKEAGAKLSNLTVNLLPTATVKWYNAASVGTAYITDASLVNGTIYYAAQILNGCESPGRFAVTADVSVPVNGGTVAAQTFCGPKVIGDLLPKSDATSGAGKYTITWYTAATAGTLIPAGTALATSSTTNKYFFTRTENVAGACESAISAEVVVTMTAQSAAPTVANTTQIFCTGGTVANLLPAITAVGPIVYPQTLWYSVSTGGTALVSSDVLTAGKYYVARLASATDCESTRVEVTVILNTDKPLALAVQPLCGTTFKVSDLVATGVSLKWYAAADATVPMALTDAILPNQNYWVTQTLNGCESAKTNTSFTIAAITATPTLSSAQSTALATYNAACGLKTLADLKIATGKDTDHTWYTTATGTTAAPTGAGLLVAGTYYVSKTESGKCESARLEVSVVVNQPAAPTAAAQTKLVSQLVSNLVVTILPAATHANWYSAVSGGLPLAGSVTLSSLATAAGTNPFNMYVSQVVNGCESARTTVAVTLSSVLDLDEFEVGAFKFGPNPVKDQLNLYHRNAIKSVEVFNMLGQQVMKLAPNAKQITVDMNRLPAAMYVVKVTDDEDKSKGFRINKQ